MRILCCAVSKPESSAKWKPYGSGSGRDEAGHRNGRDGLDVARGTEHAARNDREGGVMKRHAFTLVEVITVMMIMSLAAVVVVPVMNTLLSRIDDSQDRRRVLSGLGRNLVHLEERRRSVEGR